LNFSKTIVLLLAGYFARIKQASKQASYLTVCCHLCNIASTGPYVSTVLYAKKTRYKEMKKWLRPFLEIIMMKTSFFAEKKKDTPIQTMNYTIPPPWQLNLDNNQEATSLSPCQ
jgi:hypothetical protein